MSGGGGGSSGQVSYPEYLQVFHRFILDGSATDVLANSITDAMNAAYGSSPFTGITVIDPSIFLDQVRSTETELQTEVASYVPLTDYAEAHAAVIALYTLDTSPLDTAALDTTSLSTAVVDTTTLGTTTLSTASADSAPTKDAVTTISAPAKDVATLDVAPTKDVAPVAISYTATPVVADTIDIDEAAFAADVQTYADQLRADIENNVLPRYKAGMLNVNAITSSAYVIGEALIWAEYDRNVARYAAELRSKLTMSNDQYSVQLKIAASTQFNERVTQAQRLTAQENLAVREENRSYNLAFREENRTYKLATKDENRAYTLAFRDENKTYKVVEKEEGRTYTLAYREENRAYKLAASDQNARFKMTNTGETKDLNIAFSDQTTRLKLAASDQNSRFKLANTDETMKLKLAASEQNMRFKLQKNELDASHKLNRQKNVLMATAEVVRMLANKVEFQRVRLEASIKVNAMHVTAYNEEIHEQLVIDEADAKWNLETFQYAANLMAGISGGTSQNVKKQSKAISALGGALSGAASGAAIGAAATSFTGPGALIGAGAGAVLGGLASYLMG